MVGVDEARTLAQDACDFDDVVLSDAHELEQGWLFRLVAKRTRVYDAVIVNKETGRTLLVMRSSALSQDPVLYDRGYQFDRYDVVVFTIANVDETVRAMALLGERVVDTYYRFDRVWRVGRTITDDEIRSRLETLPAIFTGVPTFTLDEFDKACHAGYFTYELLEYRAR